MKKRGAYSLSGLHFSENASGTGHDLYDGERYLFSYVSYEDCLCDLSFHESTAVLRGLAARFAGRRREGGMPYRYRVVASELFRPLDKIHRYVFFANTLTDALARVAPIEERAIAHPESFLFGVQGMGIHTFDEESGWYRHLVGGTSFHAVSEVLHEAHEQGLLAPKGLAEELHRTERIAVFLSHKSEDLALAEQVYLHLTSRGIPTFLSERSLPAISNADYSAELDRALERAENLIVIATSKERVMSGWVHYEWSSFANEMRSGRKRGNLLTLLADTMTVDALPLLLRQFEVIPFSHMEQISAFLKI